MKKFIFILCIVATSLTACESFLNEITNNGNNETTAIFYFGEAKAVAKATTATITTEIPFVTVNGEKIEDVTFELEYRESKSGMSYADVVTVDTYKKKNGNAIFELKNLKPETDYYATIVLYAGTYGIKSSDGIVFSTAKDKNEDDDDDDDDDDGNDDGRDDKAPSCELSGGTRTEAAGVYTMLTINELEYLVDGKATEIDNVVVKYTLKGKNKYTKIVIDGSDLDGGTATVRLPKNKKEYLEEESEYSLFITVTPVDDTLEPISSKAISFETRAANVSAEISRPTLTINGDMLEVDVQSVDVMFDGLSFESYPNCNYYIYYREAGSSEWTNKTSAVLTDNGMKLEIPVATFTPGVRYEFCGAVIAGASKTLCTSPYADITISNGGSGDGDGSVDGPVTPEPPTTGDSDTSAIAGSWQLTNWQGTTPNFDIYLDITEDGIVTLYQRLTTYGWQIYYSTVSYEDGIITGVYTDDTPWSTTYSVTVDGDTMTWVSTKNENDISVYVRATLPNVVNTQATRSTVTDDRRFL